MSPARRKRVLFVCIGNACRSQMAEGFARHYGRDIIEARSAGTAAAGWVAPPTIEVMKERDIDITDQTSNQLTGEMIHDADVVITLGCGRAEALCPRTYTGQKMDWEIEDPIGRLHSVYRQVRDQIEGQVKLLIEHLRSET